MRKQRTSEDIRQRRMWIRADYARKYGGDIALRLKQTLFRKQKGLCALGHKPLAEDLSLSALEHVKSIFSFAKSPLSLRDAMKQANSESNLQLACHECNTVKGWQDVPRRSFDTCGRVFESSNRVHFKMKMPDKDRAVLSKMGRRVWEQRIKESEQE